MSKDKKPSPESNVRFPKTFSLARNRALKRGAIWTGAVCTGGFAVILLFGGLAGSNHGFTTTIDRGSSVENVVLRTNTAAERGNDGVYYLHAEGLSNAKPTGASAVLDFCKGLYDKPDLSGPNVFEKDDVQYAFAYTFYLDNVSDEKDQTFTFYVSLDAYSAPVNVGANNPFSYLRVLVYTNLDGTGEHNHTFYGAANSQGLGTVEGGKEDLRECLVGTAYDPQEDGSELRRPLSVPPEEDPYCVSFREDNAEIIREERTIHPQETLRYTIVTYFEGEDPDCAKTAPDGASITLSAHFGD